MNSAARRLTATIRTLSSTTTAADGIASRRPCALTASKGLAAGSAKARGFRLLVASSGDIARPQTEAPAQVKHRAWGPQHTPSRVNVRHNSCEAIPFFADKQQCAQLGEK